MFALAYLYGRIKRAYNFIDIKDKGNNQPSNKSISY